MVAYAVTERDAILHTTALRPDVLVLPVRPPALDGLAGAAVFGERAADRLYGLLTASQPIRVFPQLTSREHEVLDLLAGGLGIPAIAGRLGLAPKTVRNLVSAILAKVGTEDLEALLTQARNAGFGRHS